MEPKVRAEGKGKERSRTRGRKKKTTPSQSSTKAKWRVSVRMEEEERECRRVHAWHCIALRSDKKGWASKGMASIQSVSQSVRQSVSQIRSALRHHDHVPPTVAVSANPHKTPCSTPDSLVAPTNEVSWLPHRCECKGKLIDWGTSNFQAMALLAPSQTHNWPLRPSLSTHHSARPPARPVSLLSSSVRGDC